MPVRDFKRVHNIPVELLNVPAEQAAQAEEPAGHLSLRSWVAPEQLSIVSNGRA